MINFHAEKELKNFSYRVSFKSEAQITALFAPSGSGKTLTLQMIAGLEKPDNGEIEINGKTLFSSTKRVNLPPQKRNVGYLFQDYALFPNMTVEENVLFASKDRKLFGEIVELLEIGEILKKRPEEISGGQKQRVALARAIMRRPEVLLLDEPFSALHRELKENLYGELLSIVRRFNQRAVLVTHDFEEVLKLSQKVVIIEKGKTVQSGTPDEVFNFPRTVKIAKLLGHKNFFKGKVLSLERDLAVVEIHGGERVKCRFRGELQRGETVTVSILPLSVALSPQIESTRVEVLVKEVKKRGNFLQLKVLLSGKEMELHTPVSLTPNYILEEGRRTTLHLSAEQISVIREEE